MILVIQDRQDQLVLLAPLVRLVLLVRLVQLVQPVQLVPPDLLDLLDQPVLLALKEQLV